MIPKFAFLAGLVIALVSSAFSQGFGQSKPIHDWQFHLGDDVDPATGTLNTGEWQAVTVPYDWSVHYPASADNASCTGYLPGGIGWYRTEINVPADQKNKRTYLYFEGVYNRSEVFVNGSSVGERPSGFVSFMYDITPYVKPGEKNIITVRVDHSRSADSRWYTGSGIYRPVHLITASPVHIGLWGVSYVAKVNKLGAARIEIDTTVDNQWDQNAAIEVAHELVDPDGSVVAQSVKKFTVSKEDNTTNQQELNVAQPKLWDVQSPNLYTLKTTVIMNGQIVDQTATKVGIRTLTFDPDKGFALNGKWMKVKGVCLHDDAGVLGTAVPKIVWRERLLKLKAIGCNAIRMSHNPHAPELYDLCDQLGFLVMDEAFDEWRYPKKKWIEGWNKGKPGFESSTDFFEKWGTRDLADMVKRDRNHPSIIMWSIGNEVDYPNDPYSHPILEKAEIGQPFVRGYKKDHPQAEELGVIAKKLAAVVHGIDRSRPVTAALAGVVMSNETGYPGALDVVGYNYTEYRYQLDHKKYPKRIIYGSENRHDLAAWKAVDTNNFIFGQFLWTGIDYLGEAGAWPSRGSTAGLLDMANNIKPRGYFRRALWSDKPVAYLGTYRARRFHSNRLSMDAGHSWNYDPGQKIRVVCYMNGDEAQLFLNGKKVGERKPYDAKTAIIHWDIPYEPGELKVIVYKGGKAVASDTIQTVGDPATLKAEVQGAPLKGKYGVVMIPISVVDAQNRLVHGARNEVTCTISGPGKLLGLENASRDAADDFLDNKQNCMHGRLLAYIQATADTGSIDISFTAQDLKPAKVQLKIGE